MSVGFAVEEVASSIAVPLLINFIHRERLET